MDIFAQEHYKKTIRLRLKEMQAHKPGLTLKKIAARLPIQYTYLSKALNDDQTHLSEDHLFAMCRILELLPEETDFILLQRSHAVSHETSRKQYLFAKIERARRAKNLNLESKPPSAGFTDEMLYLFDPYCVLVNVALAIETYRKDPRSLAPKLGISSAQIIDILRVLERNGFIDFEESTFKIKSRKAPLLHFGRDHPLMRVHQTLFRDASNTRFNRVSEENKHSFLATFTMDEAGFNKAKEEFQGFLKKIEELTKKSRHHNVYQLSFDLFRWI